MAVDIADLQKERVFISLELIYRVEVDLPTIEVRYKNLCVEAYQELAEGKPLPTLWNTVKSMLFVRNPVFLLSSFFSC